MIRPMLACELKKEDLHKIIYPVYVSAKLDGIRGIVGEQFVSSRSGKPLRNKFLQTSYTLPIFDGCDGEFTVGEANAPDVYNKTSSGVNSAEGEPDLTFHIFDYVDFDNLNTIPPFGTRTDLLRNWLINCQQFDYLPKFKYHPQILVNNEEQLLSAYSQYLESGYEGMIIRSVDGKYKQGRSTIREQYMLKFKPFADSEAEIIGMIELQHNHNEQFQNELGYAARTSHQENKVGGGMAGALLVRDIHTGVEFKIGTGMDTELRKTMWLNKDSEVGRIVKYKYFTIGIKDKPRHPVFIGYRDKCDM